MRSILLYCLLQELHELLEDHLAAPLPAGFRLVALVEFGDDVEHGREDRADDLVAVALLVAAQHGFDELEELADFVHVLLRDLQTGVLAETHVNGQRRGEVDLDLVYERLGEGQEIRGGIGRTFDRADDAVGVEENQHVGLDLVFVHVDRDHGVAAHHHHGREAVDGCRVLGRRIGPGVERRDDQVVREVAHVFHLLLDAGDGDLA